MERLVADARKASRAARRSSSSATATSDRRARRSRAAGDRGRAPRAGAGGAADAVVARDRLGRAARGASLRLPGGLRRRRRARWLAGDGSSRARAGPAEDDVEDGRLDGVGVPRRAGVRGDRARAGAGGPLLHGHAVEARRDRPARARARGARCATRAPTCRSGALPLAPRRRAPPWNPDTVPALQRGEWRPYVEAADEAARYGSLRGQLAFRERTASTSTTSSR